MKYFFVFVAFSVCLLSCSEPKEKKKIVFSQCTMNDQWRHFMYQEMLNELSFDNSIEMELLDAEGDTKTQISQIKKAIEQNPDILIISPNESDPLQEVVSEAYRAGIPIILIDRTCNSPLYNCYIGGDNFNIGKEAASYINNSGISGSIIEIWGLAGSSPAIERHRGFIENINRNNPIFRIDGDWTTNRLDTKLQPLLGSNKIDWIFAHNDVMALKAKEVCNAMNLNNVKVIGVDALPIQGGGIDLVDKGVLNATLEYPTGGQRAIQRSIEILNGKNMQKNELMPTTLINAENVRTYKNYIDKVQDYTIQISRQKKQLSNIKQDYTTQRNTNYILMAVLIIVVILVLLLARNSNEKTRLNKTLRRTNFELGKQKKEVERLAKKAKKATNEKLKFFTNVSHEFKTPLTLIMGPLAELKEKSNDYGTQKNLKLIEVNTHRLNRLVTQLLDFRKIDNQKLKLQLQKVQLELLMKNVIQSFQQEYDKKGVKLELDAKDAYTVWADLDKLDKVIFNLLSNALKFTKSGGVVRCKVFGEANNCTITIADNGRGMSQEHLENVFDRFYTGTSYISNGTGLGLAYSKELIESHKGKISVESKKHEGTTFTIDLKTGKDHFAKSRVKYLTAEEALQLPTLGQENNIINRKKKEENKTFDTSKKTIVLVEDNEDLNEFLTDILNQSYNVISSENGKNGLSQIVEFLPDLIISDLMLPGMSGKKLITQVKKNSKTKDIPFIILTAKANESKRLELLKLGANVYLTKPFNKDVLLTHIENLIGRQPFTTNSIDGITNLKEGREHQQFTKLLNKTIEDNLSNPSLDINAICKEMGLSRIKLYRKTKFHMQTSVAKLITKKRIQLAKELLQKGFSVAQVADKSGFKTISYFSTTFKKNIGKTPSDFRKMI